MESSKLLGILGAGAAGAALMFLLDPDKGRRRRALIGDKARSLTNQLPSALDVRTRNLSNRAQGVWANTKGRFSGGANAPDQVVVARVRSEMGRIVSNPRAVNVSVNEGNVTLHGAILSHELPNLLACVKNVAGVRSVENRLQAHMTAENVQSLQGGEMRRRRAPQPQQSGFSLSSPAVAGIAGGALIVLGASLLKGSLVSQASEKRSASQQRRGGITVQKAINVDAPPDVLWGLWSNFENFPKFMKNVLEVKKTDEDLSHWRVFGPAGVTVEWDAEIINAVPNELIEWKSVDGSTMVPNSGFVRFTPNEDGTTQVSVQISYHPPIGYIGHAVATIFGADPKTEMDQDLMRMKMLLETGVAPRDAAQATKTKSAAAGNTDALGDATIH